MSTLILALPYMKEPFILCTDASMTAMGAVLLQVQYGQEPAVCYASKAFSNAQTMFLPKKREVLAVFNFTRNFRQYFWGRQLKIVTIHSVFQLLHNFKDLNASTARWLEKLASLNFEVVHRPGKSIVHADGLSRTPSKALNMVSTQPKINTQDDTGSERQNRPPETILLEKERNLLDSDESIAHCASTDFKMAAGLARKNVIPIEKTYFKIYQIKGSVASEYRKTATICPPHDNEDKSLSQVHIQSSASLLVTVERSCKNQWCYPH